MILTYEITEKAEGAKLGDVLRRDMGLSSSALKRLKRNGGIRVNGRPEYTDFRLTQGDTVEADLILAELPPGIVAEAGELCVLYEDAVLLAVNKPPGILVHPSRSRYTGTLSNFAAGYLQASGQPPFCHSVNRLDRDTSGVVLFAKNAHVKARAIASLRSPLAAKEYTAVALGALTPAAGGIALPIKRLRERDMRRVVSPDGERAVTRYKTVSRMTLSGRTASLLHLTLETGRTHQIRVHLHAVGVPLLGDRLYASADSAALSHALGLTQQLLHSHRLTMPHPLTGELLSIEAPVVRADMARLGL